MKDPRLTLLAELANLVRDKELAVLAALKDRRRAAEAAVLTNREARKKTINAAALDAAHFAGTDAAWLKANASKLQELTNHSAVLAVEAEDQMKVARAAFGRSMALARLKQIPPDRALGRRG